MKLVYFYLPLKNPFFGCNQRKSILFLTVHYWGRGFGGWWGVLGGRFLNIETGSPVIRLLLGWILRIFGALGGCPVPNTFNYPSFLYSPSVTLLYFNTVIRRVTAILRTVGSWGLSCAKHSAKEPSELWCTFPLKTVLSWTVFHTVTVIHGSRWKQRSLCPASSLHSLLIVPTQPESEQYIFELWTAIIIRETCY